MSEFDKFAKVYNFNLDNILVSNIGVSSDYFTEYKVKELYEFFKDKNEPLNILDFGCGIGKASQFLANYFPNSNVYGIDISEKSIKIAQNKVIKNCKFEVFNEEYFLLNKDFFDLIFISNVFHHIEYKEHLNLLINLRSILKSNSYIYFFEHNTLNPLTQKIVKECEFDIDAKLLNIWYAKNIFKKAGFNNISFSFILFIPPFLKKLLFLEKYLKWLPFGGQYYIKGSK